MNDIDLTPNMKEALLQIGFGVTAGPDGYYDEGGKRLDLRSAQALVRRGLIWYFVAGGAPMRGQLRLTPLGNEVLEEIRYQ